MKGEPWDEVIDNSHDNTLYDGFNKNILTYTQINIYIVTD